MIVSLAAFASHWIVFGSLVVVMVCSWFAYSMIGSFAESFVNSRRTASHSVSLIHFSYCFTLLNPTFDCSDRRLPQLISTHLSLLVVAPRCCRRRRRCQRRPHRHPEQPFSKCATLESP